MPAKSRKAAAKKSAPAKKDVEDVMKKAEVETDKNQADETKESQTATPAETTVENTAEYPATPAENNIPPDSIPFQGKQDAEGDPDPEADKLAAVKAELEKREDADEAKRRVEAEAEYRKQLEKLKEQIKGRTPYKLIYYNPLNDSMVKGIQLKNGIVLYDHQVGLCFVPNAKLKPSEDDPEVFEIA